MGPSIKYVTLFLANFYPPCPLSHLVTPPGNPPKVPHTSRPRPIFSRPSSKIRTKAPCTNSLSIVCGVFVREGLSEGLWFGRFCPGWFCSFLLLSQYICYNRKVNIILNFMFNMYDKKMYKRDVTCA